MPTHNQRKLIYLCHEIDELDEENKHNNEYLKLTMDHAKKICGR